MRKLFILLLCVITISSCSYKSYSHTSAWVSASNDRKVLYNCSMDLTVQNIDSALKEIKNHTLENKGYINKIENNSITIRIPSSKKDSIINDLRIMGKVTYITVQGKDVTDEYSDYQIRLENALKARQRYLTLLEKAENVKTAVMVEKELERLNNTIELLKGKINLLDHLTAYTTIEINLFEKTKLGPLSYVGLGLYYPIKWLFVLN